MREIKKYGFLLITLITVSCGGGGGGSSGEAPAPTPSVSVTLSLDTSSTRVNESVTLTWSSSNASSCSASGDWSGSKSTSGSESLTVTERGTKTYTLSCSNSAGTVNRSVELGVLCAHSDTNDGTLVSSLEELRTEISRVEGDGIDDIIYLQSGTYVLNEDSPIIKYHARGTVEKISIIGCHPDDVVIDGNNSSSIFHFIKNDEETGQTGWKAPFPSLYLEGFTVKNGVMPFPNGTTLVQLQELGYKGTEGGGLGSERFIGKIKNMKFLNNVRAFMGTIETEILDSHFENNNWAIYSGGSLHIKNSTFLDNLDGCGFSCSRATIGSGTEYYLEDGSVVDGNDLSFIIEDSTFTTGRRGVAGTMIVEKTVGSLAETGASLDECKIFGDHVNKMTASMGVAFTSCTVPAAGKPTFDIGSDEMEFGVGIHGEPGRKREKIKTANEITSELMGAILEDLKPSNNQEVLLHANGFGGTPLMELYLLFNSAKKILDQNNIKVTRSLIGNFTTSLDMAGGSLTVAKLDDKIVQHWDSPVHTPAMRWKI